MLVSPLGATEDGDFADVSCASRLGRCSSSHRRTRGCPCVSSTRRCVSVEQRDGRWLGEIVVVDVVTPLAEAEGDARVARVLFGEHAVRHKGRVHHSHSAWRLQEFVHREHTSKLFERHARRCGGYVLVDAVHFAAHGGKHVDLVPMVEARLLEDESFGTVERVEMAVRVKDSFVAVVRLGNGVSLFSGAGLAAVPATNVFLDVLGRVTQVVVHAPLHALHRAGRRPYRADEHAVVAREKEGGPPERALPDGGRLRRGRSGGTGGRHGGNVDTHHVLALKI